MGAQICGHGIQLEKELEAQVAGDAARLLQEARHADWELSVALTDDKGIRALNNTWRQKDAATDVLSFPQDVEGLLGDLVISLETAARQAESRGHGLVDELRILLVHGFLHLCGYDHEESSEAHLEMATKERELLGRLDWRGEGLISLAEARLPGDGAPCGDAT